ncbi:MAG: hypothetical protein IKC63_03885 [Clostridia bacterium]|nr:hypothetical protein [Clostridia bacterium]
MTIAEAITGIDQRKRNGIPEDVKIKWLSELDGRVYNELILTHDGGDSIPLPRYDENTIRTTTLLIPSPYERIYLLWLEALIDYTSGEMNRYANAYAMFNNTYAEYARLYHRTHKPKGEKLKFFGTRG